MSNLRRRPPPPSSSNNPQQQPSRFVYPTENDDVTWLDFLRTAGRTVPPPPLRSDSADRKRPHPGFSPERRDSPARVVWTGRRPSENDSSRYGGAGNSTETAIDLTSPPRFPSQHMMMSRDQPSMSNNDMTRGSARLHTRPNMGSHRGSSFTGQRRGSDTMPPKWQPDSDVDRCPVCRTDFTFFYRKHHCRKCGRVVCAACSPHRITIPRQYIVQPPNSQLDGERGGPVSPSASPYRGLGGGEVVRVCNPCVPDPWTPDAALDDHARLSGEDRRRDVSGQYYRPVPPPPPFSNRAARGAPLPPASFSTPFDYSRSLPQGPSIPNWPFQQHEATFRPTGPPPPPPPPPPPHPRHTTHRHIQSSGTIPQHPPRAGPPVPPSPSRRADTQPHTPPRPPRRIVAEEDECPVCGSELPPGETIRQQHIQECISARFSSTPSNHSAAPAPPRRTSSIPSNPNNNDAGAAAASPSRPRATSYRPRGMAIYRATEKDCLDEEGEQQECVICFEEFQPGDEMGRMECLCKFHRACIRLWWETKGMGSCPTHMLHE